MDVDSIVYQSIGYIPSGSVVAFICQWHNYLYIIYCYPPDDYISIEMQTSKQNKREYTVINIENIFYSAMIIHLPDFIKAIIEGEFNPSYILNFNTLLFNSEIIDKALEIYTTIVEESIFINSNEFLQFIEEHLKRPLFFGSIERWLHLCLDFCNFERILKMMTIRKDITTAKNGMLIESEVKYLSSTAIEYSLTQNLGTSFNETEADRLLPYIDKLRELIKLSKRKKHIPSELYDQGNQLFRMVSKSLQL